MDPAAEHQQQLRSLRDFLLVYNRMTELCFQHCVSNLNYRLLTGTEERCLEGCAGKLIHANHRLMRAYVGLMPAIMQRRAADYEASVAAAARGPATEGAGAAPGPDGPSHTAPGTGR